MLASDDPKAEAELRSARLAQEEGRLEEAKARYEAFIRDRSADPLLPMARLELGKIMLGQGDLQRARPLFELVEQHPDAAVSERGQLYGGIVAHRLGEPQRALKALRPLIDRVVDAEERSEILATVAECSALVGDRAGAVSAWDRFLGAGGSGPALEKAQERLRVLVARELGSADIQRLYGTLPRSGTAWPLVAHRAAMEAYARKDTATVLSIAAAMREQRVEIDAALQAVLVRAERSADADPRVFGAILPLTGRGREVGQLALRGMMLGASDDAAGATGAGVYQVIFRDSAGDPQRAARAVDDLVSLHRAIAIVGPVEATTAAAVAKRAEELGVPVLALSPGSSGQFRGRMIFDLFGTFDAEIGELLAAAHARGARRLLVLRPDHAYGTAVEAAAKRQAQRLHIDVAGSVSYEAGTTNFRKTTDALQGLQFDMILLADTSRQVALIAPSLAAVGVWSTPRGGTPPNGGKAVTLVLPAVSFDAALLQHSHRYLQGAIVSRPYDATVATGAGRKLVADYGARYGGTPDVFVAHAFDAVRLLRRAVESGARSRIDLAGRLPTVTLDDFAGPSAGFDAHGPKQATRLYEIRDRQLVALPTSR